MLDEEEGPFAVDRKDKIPFLFRNGFNGILTRHACNVHENVNLVAEALRSCIHNSLDLLFVRHVCGQTSNLITRLLQLCHSRIDAFLLKVGNKHARAALGQSGGNTLTNCAGCAGHKCCLSCKIKKVIHSSVSPLFVIKL